MANRDPSRVVLLAALMAATGLVVLLGWQARAMRAAARAAGIREQYMLAGMYVPKLELPTLSGELVVIGAPHAGTRQILLLYNTTCTFCAAGLPAWATVAEAASELDAEVIGLSIDLLDETLAYAGAHHLTFPTALLASDRDKVLLRADAVPQTLVVDSAGRVLLARPGNLSPSAVDSVLAAARSLPIQGRR